MVTYTPSEDTRYAFAVGRVRAREAQMLSRQQIERLIDMRGENQIMSTLADTPYGETRAEDVDTMLMRASFEEEAFFKRYLMEEKVHLFFTAFDLVNNLKWAVRKYYGAAVDESAFIQAGSPSQEEYAKMLEGEKSAVPEWLSEVAGNIVAANYERLEPSSIDIISDRALIEYLYTLSEGYSFLRFFLTMRVDFANLLIMLRLKTSQDEWEAYQNVFLPYGSVKFEKYKRWWEAGRDVWPTLIPQTQPFVTLGEGLGEAKESFLLLEREIKEAEIAFFLSTRRLTFGYEPLVGYSFIKREERRNIGKVLAGIRYGLNQETIRKSIAWF